MFPLAGIPALLLSATGIAPLRIAQDGFVVPAGFSVSRATEGRHSYLNLTFDVAGRMILATEAEGLLVAVDADGDGSFEEARPLVADLLGVQGLCADGDTLFAVGRRAGRSALWRVALTGPDRSASAVTEIVPIDDEDEHGAHAVVLGPDGALYVAIGDQARLATEPELGGWVPADVEPLLSPIADPGGFGARSRFPFGHIVRIDPTSGAWRYHSVGYRNHYDLAFTPAGDLFTCDSDMELDVGLPWYRPVRVLLCTSGVDYGSRAGSAVWPGYVPEIPPAVAELGRGSPTGICVYGGELFGERYRGALLLADWTNANVRALFLEPDGSGFTARHEVLVQARGALSITDLAVGPDGALYFVSGGRGTRGAVYRLGYEHDAESAALDPAPRPPSPRPPGPRPPKPQAPDREPAGPDPRTGADFPPGDPWTVAAGRPYEDHPLLRQSFHAVVAELALAPRDRRTELFALRWIEREREHELLGTIAPDLLTRFPRGESDVDRELARLLAKARPAGTIDALLDELERTPSREDAIHYAYCLRAIDAGWNEGRLARLFGWFEEASAWSGGGNFQGYLDAMLNEVTDRVPIRTAERMSATGELGPRVLASFLARKDPVEAEALFEPLKTAFAALDDEENVFLAMQQKRRLLAASSGSRVAGMTAWARAVYEDEPRLRDACLLLLARSPEAVDRAADWERFARGLESGDPDVREACALALVKSERKPTDPALVRRTLDQARARGPRGGRKILRVVSVWSGRPPGPPGADWEGELAEWERWFTRTYPEFVRAAAPDARPRWDFEQTLAFLERTASRPGSPARGARVFEKATCITCHTLGGPDSSRGTGWGPDLTDVAGRLDRRALLEAIVWPSRVIADRFHVTLVTTYDGEELEGRLVEDAPDRIVLLRTNGTRMTIPRADTTFVGPSDVSAMPEGLLGNLTLEEVKDLFAFLGARGETSAAGRAEPEWIDMLGDAERRFWRGDFSGWRLSGGALTGRAEDLPRSTYIVYGRELADFELEFDVRAPQANTGVQYRSKLVPGEVHPVGYQADVGQSFWGALYATDGRGLLARPELAARRAAVAPQGWNHFHVRVDGDRHAIEVNGLPMVDVRDDAHASGILALQLHQKMSFTAAFANLRVRPLR